ncbi:MAG: glycosyltransferase family 4 protein [Sporolactobacillus sp.]
MKVGFISEFDVHDKRAWSGTINFLYIHLSEHYQMIPIVIKSGKLQRAIRKIVRKCTKGSRNYTGIDIAIDRYHFAHKIHQAVSNEGVSVFFAPASSNLIGVGIIPKECKLVYLSDATYHCMVGYYYDGGSVRNMKLHDMAENNSLVRADAIIYSSQWAKEDAVGYYNIKPEKIHVLPFGANLEDRYIRSDNLNEKTTIHMLLVGVDWKRKGIDLAINCVEKLNNRGSKWQFQLTIVGFNKPENFEKKHIEFAGHLNKNNREECERMITYYLNNEIFILPTKAECSAIVFSEAAMYGLPVFTHDTGGTMTYVEDGVTGRGLQLGSTADDFADAILDMLNHGNLQQWSDQARQKYEKELNWNVWLTECIKLLEE